MAAGALTGCGSLLPFGRGASGAIVRSTVGVATTFDIRDKVPDFLATRGFEILRVEESADGMLIETGWRERAPLPDEEERGIVAARIRVLVTSSPRHPRVEGSATLNRVEFTGETMVLEPDGSWRYSPLEEEARAELRRLAADLELELGRGPRRFRPEALPAVGACPHVSPTFPSEKKA